MLRWFMCVLVVLAAGCGDLIPPLPKQTYPDPEDARQAKAKLQRSLEERARQERDGSQINQPRLGE